VRVRSLDHLVLTVEDIDATVRFYALLGMQRETFGDGRIALRFGDQKLNLHQAGAELAPHAARPTRGSADLCRLVEGNLEEVVESLTRADVPVELGPVARTGAKSALNSVYVRDPDGNLVELSQPLKLSDDDSMATALTDRRFSCSHGNSAFA
jgi:catechol 2,3-dioxygenase-like lactoylglutathione lyase family enzyme